jgi:hypothetical protein
VRLLAGIQGVVWFIQLLTCGFSFSFIFSSVSRVLFACKLLGMRVKLRTVITLEIVGIVMMVFLPIVFGWQFSFLRVFLTILFAAISVAIAWYDDYFFVYTEEDVVVAKKEEATQRPTIGAPKRAS